MVRKRGRGRGSTTGFKRRTSRTYESDEIESDVELDLESPPVSPEEPKRYGLRQRTKRPILTDYYYDDDEETIPTKDESDDDQDYNVVEDLQTEHSRVTEKVYSSKHTERRKSTRERTESTSVVIESREVDPIVAQGGQAGDRDGPVDFEDMIRADVVNKQKLDYDNVVNRTEIHVEPLPVLKISKIHKVKPVTGRRRGRRPKEPKNEEDFYHVTAESFGNDVNSIITNGDSNEAMEVQLDPTEMMSEYLDDPREGKENGVTKEEKPKPDSNCLENSNKLNGVAITIKAMDKPEACEPPDLDPKEKEIVLSNEYLLANTFDCSAEEFVKKQEEDKNKPDLVEEEPVKQLIFESDDNSDDDVIIIEKKPEIIVLDDDD